MDEHHEPNASLAAQSEPVSAPAIGAQVVAPPATTTPETVFEASEVSIYYGDFRAVTDVSFSIYQHEITAFIGPSGCGKTTVLRTLNRMNDTVVGTRHSGVITLDGENIYDRRNDATALRQRVGMVFQRWNPFPKSIYDNVAYGPRINGRLSRADLDALVESSLRRAALWDEVKDRLRQSALGLSGGQQQRLCIARALANDPEVLLLDEPASALDPIATQKVEELVYELKRELTIVIVTHNLQQAARISDQTAFFYLGKLIEMGDTQRLFTSPREERTEAYITGRFG